VERSRDGRSRWTDVAIGVAAAAVIVAMGYYFLVVRPRSQAGAPPAVGDAAPSVTLTELATGKPLRLPGDLAGRPYSLTFFSYT